MTATKLDERTVNAAACRHLNTILGELVDYKGRGNWEVNALCGDHFAEPVKLKHWRVIDQYTGAWVDVGEGVRGNDLVSLAEHLGRCDRKLATAFLGRLVARLEKAAA